MHRHIQAHRLGQKYKGCRHTEAHRLGQKYKGFPHEHNIQVVLASHRGMGRAWISVAGRTMLQSMIVIDLSGPEVVAIFRDLALSANTQEVLMSSV